MIDKCLAISFRDTGISIPESKLERVFESFEQAQGFTDRVYGCAGLGLAISKKYLSRNFLLSWS